MRFYYINKYETIVITASTATVADIIFECRYPDTYKEYDRVSYIK